MSAVASLDEHRRPSQAQRELLRICANAHLLSLTPPVPAETVHNGSDDLFVFPPSVVETFYATSWIAARAARDEAAAYDTADKLTEVCQSSDRAWAVIEKVRTDQRAVTADRLLARAFGAERPS